MEEPRAEEVLRNIYDLYENPDISVKETASKWLEAFQKSVYSWKIADQLLQQKNDLHSCYFAAQTMRSKIQHSFQELPESAHASLRDSIVAHIEHISLDTNPIITKQLCLALSNLILLMASWQQPIDFLLEKFTANLDSIQPLLLTLAYIPEEIDAKYLRLGENRRKQVLHHLEASSPKILRFLEGCLTNSDPAIVHRIQLDAIACFTSWVKMDCVPVGEASSAYVFSYAFQILMNPGGCSEKQLDTASDCICSVIESINLEKTTPELEQRIFDGIMHLEHAYQESVVQEDADKSMILCRIFTVVAEVYLPRMVSGSSTASPHYSVKALDSLIMCVGHFDFEVAQITFNVWYKLSEVLYEKDNDELTKLFERYVERLIESLYRHCQLDPDHDGLVDKDGSFYEFRSKVSELIKDVIFIVKSVSCFEHMFGILKKPNVTWEATEAAMFIMECIARNIYVEENIIVPQVIHVITVLLPNDCKIAIRYTSVNILGQLCEWIAAHPNTLDAVLNFLVAALQMKALASAAAQSLQLICSACHREMINLPSRIGVLIEIAKHLESFEVQPEAATLLLKGISVIVSRLPNVQITDVMRQLCSFQIAHLDSVIASKKDPSQWIDRLASIYRHIMPRVKENEENPAAVVIIENWPHLSATIECYKQDDKIMERIVRCIRYAIRCIGAQALPIFQPLVGQMVTTYASHHQSCLLYLGSVLVDEFGYDNRCVNILLKMLEAFIEPTFTLLQAENGLKEHPDTVDDFFRLSVRFIQRLPLPFLQHPIVAPIIQCAILASTLDHRDANMSVMKFFSNLLAHGKFNGDPEIKPFVIEIIQTHGETLISKLLYSSIFYLHSNMLGDVADVFMEIKLINSSVFNGALYKALSQLPRTNAGGSITATDDQMSEFYQNLSKPTVSLRNMTHELQDFCRLYR